MKKYFFLIVGLIALAVGTLSAQRGGTGGKTVLTPTPVTPEMEEPLDPQSGSGSGTDRTVVWVHGYEGGRNAWSVYGDKFKNEYKMRSIRTEYKNVTTIPQGAVKAQQDILAQFVVPSSNNIFIGHSMGGLVTREIERQRVVNGEAPLFGGFITFSTPHKGAILANSVMEGKGDIFVDDAIHALVGPFSGTWVSNFLLNLATVNNHLQLIRRILPSGTPIGDLATTSQFISMINTVNYDNKKIITVAAKESGEKLWRELSSLFLHAPSDLQLHQHGDDDLPQKMNNLRGVYNGAGVVSGVIAVVSACNFNFGGAAAWAYRSVKFFVGASWIKNAPKVFDNLVGANRMEQRQTVTRQIRSDIMDRWDEWKDDRGCYTPRSGPRPDCSFNTFMRTLSAADLNNLYENVTTTVQVPVINEENDGIALKSSTNGLIGNDVKTIETRLLSDLGVNHQECMNHEFITEIFEEKIFNGTNGSFFSIARR